MVVIPLPAPRRRRWGAGLAALAFALAASPHAFAQFAATPTVNSGSIVDGVTGGEISSSTDLFIVDRSAVVTWRPDGSGPFLPAASTGSTSTSGTTGTVTFWDGGTNTDFTVLNRILSSSPAVFEGRVQSVVGNQPGGSVWFSSPGGIIVNAGASFDVGNLLLTTADLTSTATDNGWVALDGAAGATPRIANYGILQSRGYTALVAPRITQAGYIRAGGTAAMALGEDVRLRIPSANNLFDIEITVGTAADSSGGVLLDHSGETLSTASLGSGPRRVYIAALSTGAATSLLLGGTIQANDAALTDNGIVLSAGGNIVGGAAVAGSGGPIDVEIAAAPRATSGTDIYPHRSDGGIDMFVSGNLTARAGSALVAADGVSLDVAGRADLSGLLLGQTIAIGAADVGIAPTAAIGDAATDTITLRPRGGTVFIGGSGGSGFAIDGAELGRLQATQLVVTGGAATPAADDYEVTIGTAAIDGGRIGSLRVTTPGSMLVNGKLTMANTRANSVVELRADRRLDVVTPAGGIALDAGGALAGTLVMAGANILVADPSVAALSRAQPRFDDRRAVLERAAATPVAAGFVSAGQLRFEVSDTLHVQNSGNTIAYGGVSTNQLTIAGSGNAGPEVILSGRQTTATGLIDDYRLRDEVTFTGISPSGGAINGCLLNVATCFIVPPTLDLATLNELTGSLQNGAIIHSPAAAAAQLVDTSALDPAGLVVIEEPVTGAGNEDNWNQPGGCIETEQSKCP